MQPKRKIQFLSKLVQRENAARLMLISMLSFVATVAIVRSFLVFTGYPQIGGGTLHIAHVLWGGLILYIAAILPLIYLNPRMMTLVAALSGVGVGLFIDEVGKFITTQYDYFFPAAAPIMYVFFLLIVILVVMINRPDTLDGKAELLQALELVQEQLYRPLEEREKARFEQEISVVVNSDPNPMHVDLARYLLAFLKADVRVVEETSPAWWLRIANRFERWTTEIRLRWFLEAGLLLSCLLAFKNPVQVWLERIIPGSPLVSFLNAHFGREITSLDAPLLFNVRLGLEIMVGVVFLVAVILLFSGKKSFAIQIGFFSLLVSLAVLDLLLFYFEQFSSVLIVAFHLIVLFGVMDYRRKFLKRSVDRLDIKT